MSGGNESNYFDNWTLYMISALTLLTVAGLLLDKIIEIINKIKRFLGI
jgi:hypothetical protein